MTVLRDWFLITSWTHRFDPCQDDGEPEGGDHDASGEEIRQLPAGAAGRVAVVTHPFCDEVGNGADEVEN